MARPAEVTDYYRLIIEEVVRQSLPDFAECGVEDHVLYDLQMLWEQKLIATHVLDDNAIVDSVFPGTSTRSMSRTLPQVDGSYQDEDDDEQDSDDEKTATQRNQTDNALGSDLDDEEEDVSVPAADQFIMCQYEKVTRTKNKWRCQLKAGMMHLSGRDYLFNKANGEFEW